MDRVDPQLLEALDNTRPTISLDLVRELMAEQGFESSDPRCAKLTCAAVERFMSKVLNDVLDVMASRPASASRSKDVGWTLTLYDLVKGLQEAGVVIDKPTYYVSKPAGS